MPKKQKDKPPEPVGWWDDDEYESSKRDRERELRETEKTQYLEWLFETHSDLKELYESYNTLKTEIFQMNNSVAWNIISVFSNKREKANERCIQLENLFLISLKLIADSCDLKKYQLI